MTDIVIPKVFKFLKEPKRYKVGYGGRGGGKSWGFIDTAIVDGMENPLRFLCAREIQKSIKDSVHRLLSDRIRHYNLEWFYTIKNESIVGKNGTEFLFAGLKHNVTQIKSFEGIDRVIVEEAENVSDNSWETLIPTIRKPGSEIWVIFNVKNLSDPTYQRFVANPSDDTIAVMISWRDNPFFPDVLRQEMEKLKESDFEAYEHVWEGKPDTRRSGAVYAKQIAQARQEGRITLVPYSPTSEVFTALDLGYGDSTAIWWLQWQGRELRWLEYYENSGEQINHYADIIKSKPYSYSMAYLPHDGGHGNIRGDSVSKQLTALGVKNIVLPREQDITPGIELLRQTIAFSVFDEKKCRDGIHALENYGYEWDEDRKMFKKNPRHDWTSHCFVGNTSVLTRLGMQHIKDLPYTGQVLTLCGWKPYKNPRITRRNAQLVEVAFKDGTTVRCTPDHLFLTANGWKSAESLEKGSLIQSSLTQYRNILMEKYIRFGHLAAAISNIKNTFTGLCGKMLLAPFLINATFTTGTVAGQITPYATLSASMHLNTCGLHGKRSTPAGMSISLLKQDEKHLTGISQKKGGCGTNANRRDFSYGRSGKGSPSHALIVANNLWRSFASKVSISFAILTARPLIIESIKPIQTTEDVWCLTVPGIEHFSLSNGAIAHNCADAARYSAIAARKAMQAPVIDTVSFARDSSAGWQAG